MGLETQENLYLLDIGVGLSDNDVMKSDIASGAPAPPPTQTTRAAVSREVRSMSVTQIEQELTGLLMSAQLGRTLPETAVNTSPEVSSLVAVWLISQVGEAVGKPKLVKLSNVDKLDLRSVGGVSRVVHEALRSLKLAEVSS